MLGMTMNGKFRTVFSPGLHIAGIRKELLIIKEKHLFPVRCFCENCLYIQRFNIGLLRFQTIILLRVGWLRNKKENDFSFLGH